MILEGSRERTRTIGAGTFHCPREHGTRRYSVHAVRRWVMVGPLHVLPGRERCRFVECQTCHSTFDAVVLERPHTHLEDVLTAMLRRAVAVILTAAPSTSTDLRRAAVIVMQRHAATPYRPDDLTRDLEEERSAPGRSLAELDEMAVRLSTRGRSTLVTAVAQLLRADRDIAVERVEAMDRVALAVGVPVERIRALTSQHSDAHQRRPGRSALAV